MAPAGMIAAMDGGQRAVHGAPAGLMCGRLRAEGWVVSSGAGLPPASAPTGVVDWVAIGVLEGTAAICGPQAVLNVLDAASAVGEVGAGSRGGPSARVGQVRLDGRGRRRRGGWGGGLGAGSAACLCCCCWRWRRGDCR